MTIPLDAQYVDVPIFNQLVPGEGPKAIRAVLDFSATDSFALDLTNQVESGIIKAVQTLYIDASELLNPVTFVADRTQQRITVMPDTQGYYPFLLPNPPQFNGTSQAQLNSVVIIHMLNVPMPAQSWATA